jgi:hypothetical protein
MTMPSSGGTVSAAPGVSTRSRLRRWGEFVSRFPDLAEMNALDLGGTTAFWEAAPVRPGSLRLRERCDWLHEFETPRWNGKVARVFRTLDTEWAHRCTRPNPATRDRAPSSCRRPHTAASGGPPVTRVQHVREQDIRALLHRP